MKNKIVVIGSSNVDLIMKMERLPEKGETITDADFFQVYGGKGANQAVGAVRAGGNVAFVNCVGDDAYTPQMLKKFITDGLDIRFVFHEKGIASGHALVMIGEVWLCSGQSNMAFRLKRKQIRFRRNTSFSQSKEPAI